MRWDHSLPKAGTQSPDHTDGCWQGLAPGEEGGGMVVSTARQHKVGHGFLLANQREDGLGFYKETL